MGPKTGTRPQICCRASHVVAGPLAQAEPAHAALRLLGTLEHVAQCIEFFEQGYGAPRAYSVVTKRCSSGPVPVPEPPPFSLSGTAMARPPMPKRKLSFANTVRELSAGDRDGRSRERLEPGHRRTTPLDRTMVLLDDLVQVLAGPHFDVAPARVVALKEP
jgi:hypothetical protein